MHLNPHCFCVALPKHSISISKFYFHNTAFCPESGKWSRFPPRSLSRTRAPSLRLLYWSQDASKRNAPSSVSPRIWRINRCFWCVAVLQKRATSLLMSLLTVYKSAELHEWSRTSISKSCFMATIILTKPQTRNLSASYRPGCNLQ